MDLLRSSRKNNEADGSVSTVTDVFIALKKYSFIFGILVQDFVVFSILIGHKFNKVTAEMSKHEVLVVNLV